MKISKEIYLKNKKEQEKAFEKIPRKNYCYQCVRPVGQCFCSKLKPIKPRIQVVILIHPMEAKKEKMGTGRLTHLSLANSKLIMGIDFTHNDLVNEMIVNKDNSCYLLYPGIESIDLSQSVQEINKSELKTDYQLQKNIIVFVIDGTWPCAKKMMKLSTNLHRLKRLSFKVESPSLFHIKEQPGEFCLSTVESVHLMLNRLIALDLEDSQQDLDQMIVLFQEMVDFQINCARDPNLPSYKKSKKAYKDPSQRVKSKKWESRKIIY